mgnify:CR=1 FL=1
MAKKQSSLINKILMLGLIILVASIAAYPLFKKPMRLKIYSPADVNPELVDESMQKMRGEHIIADFNLTNQEGQQITRKDVEGKIYIADFFFTTCGNICPKMTYQMERINEFYKKDDDIMFVSHSVTPEIDSVPVLKKYAIEHNVVSPKWHLLTGDKDHIYELARKSYFSAKIDWKGDLGDFIHTENFCLIDKEGRIRGYYDGTSTEDVNTLIKEIKILQAEYN